MGRCFSLLSSLSACSTLALVGALSLSSSSSANSLQETIAYTIETNPEVLISINQLRASEEQVDIERAGYLPKLGVSGRLGWQRKHSRLSSGNSKTTDRVGETSISLKQMLFDGFRTSNRVEGAEMDTQSRSMMMHARAESVALKVAEVYLKVIRSEQLVELARENLAVHDEIYDQIFQRADSGLSRSSDLEQIRSRRARASANLITAINTLSNSRSEYFSIVNRKPLNLMMPMVDSTLLPVSLDEAMAMAGQNNPTIQAASYDIKTYEAQADATKSNFLPQLDIEVGQSWSDIRSDIPASDGRNDTLSAMLNFSYNIYNGGADQARRREAAWRIEEARASRELSYRNITRDLRLAWDAFIYLDGQVQYLEEHITASREVAKAYQQQFRLGKRSLLDLLDTENELFQSQRDFIQTVHEELFSRYRILQATGQLLESMNVDLPMVLQAEMNFRATLPEDQ
ncbi:TolC family outer membrane protein [Parendozoicomonas haliclonae]|uniref:Outer membrane efflux protein BepC n=1 Tax=Parendozoicomonas haliclonae TaxID=1960125 RepID=A0A1X7AJF4_9GAMM|nr:TolC family outer membrane protein [Parendozoicomonas haliclonae]SMA45853.1 Outer membrane efflux protein BepC precursor [Parendozoicomonas haliclonae]